MKNHRSCGGGFVRLSITRLFGSAFDFFDFSQKVLDLSELIRMVTGHDAEKCDTVSLAPLTSPTYI